MRENEEVDYECIVPYGRVDYERIAIDTINALINCCS